MIGRAGTLLDPPGSNHYKHSLRVSPSYKEDTSHGTLRYAFHPGGGSEGIRCRQGEPTGFSSRLSTHVCMCSTTILPSRSCMYVACAESKKSLVTTSPLPRPNLSLSRGLIIYMLRTLAVTLASRRRRPSRSHDRTTTTTTTTTPPTPSDLHHRRRQRDHTTAAVLSINENQIRPLWRALFSWSPGKTWRPSATRTRACSWQSTTCSSCADRALLLLLLSPHQPKTTS